MKNIFKLLILSLLCVCFNAHAQVPGTPYILPSTAKPNGVIVGLACCSGATISVTPCSDISGARLNDDNTTTPGIEYDWAGAIGYMAGNDSVRSLVQMNGQCWYRYNAINIPTNFSPSPAYNSTTDVGYSEIPPFASTITYMGRVYQWSAAMNGSTTERAQGICAPGFHVPSACETVYRIQNWPSRWANIGGGGSQDSVNEASLLSGFTLPNPWTRSGFNWICGAYRDGGSAVNWSSYTNTISQQQFHTSTQVIVGYPGQMRYHHGLAVDYSACGASSSGQAAGHVRCVAD